MGERKFIMILKSKFSFKNSTVIYLLLLILHIIFCVAPIQVFAEDVVVFILDTEVANDFVEHKSLPLDGYISHGSIVGRIIREEAPYAQIHSFAVEDELKFLQKEYYLAALEEILEYKKWYFENRVLVNISIAFSEFEESHYRLIKQLEFYGVLVIAAAGNDNSAKPVYPAGFKEVVAVADATKEQKASYSNYGEYIDVSAPGSVEYIASQYFPGEIWAKNIRAHGTSFAAPRVVGLIADLLGKAKDLTPKEALKIVLDNADPFNDLKYAGQLGAGIINREKSLLAIKPYYRMQKNLMIIIILGCLIIGGYVVWQRAGPGGVFLALLVFFVMTPLILLVLSQLQTLIVASKIMQLRFIDWISIFGSILLVFVLTKWEKGTIALSYGCLCVFLIIMCNTPNNLKMQPYLFITFWLWVFIMISYERFSIYRLQKIKTDYQRLIPYISSKSIKVSNLAKSYLCQAGGEGEELILFEIKRATSSKKKRLLINLLAQIVVNLEKTSLDLMLTLASFSNKVNSEMIDLVLKKSKEILPELLQILKENDLNKKRLAAKILQSLDAEVVVVKIKDKLLKNTADTITIILEILLGYGQQASEAVPEVLRLLQQNDDMWVRFYALRVLVTIHPNPKELYPLLISLKEDQHELVRLEAAGLLAENFG